MIITLIRHGMTEANEKRLYCGSTDLPLSGKGVEGLDAFREQIAYPEADVYITSGLARADETLRILYNREPDMVMPELREMDFGVFEMKSYEDLKDVRDYRRWIGGESGCPGGENREIFENRVNAGFAKLSGLKTRTAAAVCHGGVIVTIMEVLFSKQRNFYEWQPGYGRGYTVEVSRGGVTLLSEI